MKQTTTVDIHDQLR